MSSSKVSPSNDGANLSIVSIDSLEKIEPQPAPENQTTNQSNNPTETTKTDHRTHNTENTINTHNPTNNTENTIKKDEPTVVQSLTSAASALKVGRVWRIKHQEKTQTVRPGNDIRFRKRDSLEIAKFEQKFKGQQLASPHPHPNARKRKPKASPEKLSSLREKIKSEHDPDSAIAHETDVDTKPKTGGLQVQNSALSVDDDDEEYEEESRAYYFVERFLFGVINHNTKWIHYWDWMIISMTVYSMFIVPLTVSFSEFDVDNRIEFIVDLVFILDIWICFRVTYLDEQKFEVWDIDGIRRKYLRGWFTADVLASIPMDTIAGLVTSDQQTIRWLGVNRFLRIARLLKKLNEFVEGGFARIIKLLIVFVLIAHFVACGFYLISKSHGSDVAGGRWLDRYDVIQQPASQRYLASLYWAYATLGTVGYGDITATSVPERIFAIFAMIFGSVIYASIFGTLTTLIASMDRNKERYNGRVSVISEFCTLNNMPKFILNRLRAYLDATWVMRKGLSVEEVMEGVPLIVKSEIMMFIYSDLIRQVPMFSQCDKRFLEKMVLKFRPQAFLVGDFLIREGDLGKELFFILNGNCEVRKSVVSVDRTSVLMPAGDKEITRGITINEGESRDNTDNMLAHEDRMPDVDDILTNSILIALRGPGSFVGEGALLAGKRLARRKASVHAVSDVVQTMMLLKEDLAEVAAEFPEVLKVIHKHARMHQRLHVHVPNKSKAQASRKRQSTVAMVNTKRFRNSRANLNISNKNLDLQVTSLPSNRRVNSRKKIDKFAGQTFSKRIDLALQEGGSPLNVDESNSNRKLAPAASAPNMQLDTTTNAAGKSFRTFRSAKVIQISHMGKKKSAKIISTASRRSTIDDTINDENGTSSETESSEDEGEELNNENGRNVSGKIRESLMSYQSDEEDFNRVVASNSEGDFGQEIFEEDSRKQFKRLNTRLDDLESRQLEMINVMHNIEKALRLSNSKNS